MCAGQVLIEFHDNKIESATAWQIPQSCSGTQIFGEIMLKFVFSVKTRDGLKVESVQIYGKDLPDAERKLRQMYHHCEVTGCKEISTDKVLGQSLDIQELLSEISKQN
jgi:hypothetical protein